MINHLGFTCPLCQHTWRTEGTYREHLEDHSQRLQLAYIELAEAAVTSSGGSDRG